MKRCPQCSQVYTDDMSFCLSDGTPLLAVPVDAEEPTLVRPSARGSARASSGIWWKILAAAAILLLGFVVLAGIAAWVFWPRDRVVGSGNNANPRNTVTPAPTSTRSGNNDSYNSNLRTQQEDLERERKRIADERRRQEELRSKPADTPEPPQFKDPGTTRIAFKRGSMGETVSGTVGQQRRFVLRTLAGQYLSATVRSPGGCVAFTDGGSSTAYPTQAGDSFLTLRNNCGEPSRFTLSVNVR